MINYNKYYNLIFLILGATIIMLLVSPKETLMSLNYATVEHGIPKPKSIKPSNNYCCHLPVSFLFYFFPTVRILYELFSYLIHIFYSNAQWARISPKFLGIFCLYLPSCSPLFIEGIVEICTVLRLEFFLSSVD